MQDIISLQKIVKKSGMHNFLGTQIQVDSQLNLDKWQVHECWDVQLFQLLHYGFPLDLDLKPPLKYELTNYSSAIQHNEDVKAYLDEENRRGTSQPLTIKGLVLPKMALLHSFLRRETVLFSCETVVCIFNGIFPGCELVSTSAE